MNSSDRQQAGAASANLLPAVILPKIQEARRIADAARWSMLDVVIWLTEVEDDIVRGSKAALHATLDDLDLTGPAANRVDTEAREYQPDDDRDWWCP